VQVIFVVLSVTEASIRHSWLNEKFYTSGLHTHILTVLLLLSGNFAFPLSPIFFYLFNFLHLLSPHLLLAVDGLAKVFPVLSKATPFRWALSHILSSSKGLPIFFSLCT
jgi:hypothetical protein